MNQFGTSATSGRVNNELAYPSLGQIADFEIKKNNGAVRNSIKHKCATFRLEQNTFHKFSCECFYRVDCDQTDIQLQRKVFYRAASKFRALRMEAGAAFLQAAERLFC
jgi:hypothetical protein